jgi:hypothetical protein
MGDWLRRVWRETHQEFWKTGFYVAFWGAWTWIFSAALGGLAGVAALLARYRGFSPVIAYLLLGAFLTFVLLVIAGRIAKRRNIALDSPSPFLLRDKIGIGMEYGDNRVQLLIANQDRKAEYYGVFNISGGPVHTDRKTELFCRWTHTDSIRTKIARGQTCRILLARMETEPRMLSFHWVIETVTEKGPDKIPAEYSSLGSTTPLTYAPDIILTGSIFRDPESDGPQTFRVVLHGFGAALE